LAKPVIGCGYPSNCSGRLANWRTCKQILESCPRITREDILAALAFAEEIMREQRYITMHKAAV
jgi:uncharacterized protein (DUF433 family)